MLQLYLDQFAWIDLARAVHGRANASNGASDALAVIRHGVDQRLLSCPLSAQHYMETLVRSDAASRHRLGSVMAQLSRFNTIAPPSVVLASELDLALSAMIGKPSTPDPVQPFGSGIWFAFGKPERPYQVPEEVKKHLPRPQVAELEQAGNLLLQNAAIMGPLQGSMPGMMENGYYAEFGERYADGERRLAEALRKHEALAQLDDVIAATEIIDILGPLNEALERVGPLSDSEFRHLDSAVGLTNLLRLLPSRTVAYKLRRLRHENGQTKWEANDLEDIAALSVAIPYCDVVVTERHWTHLAHRAGLDARFATVVVPGLRAALPYLIAGV